MVLIYPEWPLACLGQLINLKLAKCRDIERE